MEPIYRIYYGKYPDQLTNEIPNEQIVSVDGLSFRIEPGKPAEPKVDKNTFTLSNLDHTGTERYDEAWFTSNSLSEAEGAIVPLQLFFRVEMPGFDNRGFTGVVSKKSYGKYRETVTVTIKDPRDLIKEGDVYLLKPFTFENAFCTGKQASATGFPNHMYSGGNDLNGDPLTDEYVFFNALQIQSQGSYEGLNFDHPYAEHRDLKGKMEDAGDPFPTSTGESIIWADTRSAFISIGENTILTRISENITIQKDVNDTYFAILKLVIAHANNGNYETPDQKVIERGRFFPDGVDSTFEIADNYSIKIVDYNLGNSDDILFDQKNIFQKDANPTFINGYEITEEADPSTEYFISFGVVSYFNTLTELIDIFNEKLYTQYYDNPANADLFDTALAPTKHLYAFWPDLMIYGWLDSEPQEILVNLATQLNCYLYFNEEGKIVFHDRLHHEAYLPDQLPPGAFQVQLEDIEPIGNYEDSYGFDSYKVEYHDRIEINNVESDESRKIYVGPDGIRDKAALRSSTLTVNNYRSGDLGVPAYNDPVDQLLFRYSPNDPAVVGFPMDDISNFVPTPEIQAQNFAKSWSYPVSLWPIKVDLNEYPDVGIGAYFWVSRGGINEVYFIRDITYKQNWSAHMQAQKIGTWNG